MKKGKNIKGFIKLVLLSIVVIYAILNLTSIVLVKNENKEKLNNYILPITQGIITENNIKTDTEMKEELIKRYGENTPTTIISYAQGYFIGQSEIIKNQEIIIGISLIVGIIVAIVIKIIKRIITTKSKDKKTHIKNKI